MTPSVRIPHLLPVAFALGALAVSPAAAAQSAFPQPVLPEAEASDAAPRSLALPLVAGLGDVSLDPPDVPTDVPLRWSHTPAASAPLGLVAQVGATLQPAEGEPAGGAVGPFVRLAHTTGAPALTGRLYFWQADPAPREGWDVETRDASGNEGDAPAGRSFLIEETLYADGSAGFIDLGPWLDSAGLRPDEGVELVFEPTNVDVSGANARVRVLSFSPRGEARTNLDAPADPAGGALWYEGPFRLERNVEVGNGEAVTLRMEGSKVPGLTTGTGHFAPERLLLLPSGGLLGTPWTLRAFLRDEEGNEGARIDVGSGVLLGSTIELDASGLESRDPAAWDSAGASGERPYDLVFELETGGASPRAVVPVVLPQGRSRPSPGEPASSSGAVSFGL